MMFIHFLDWAGMAESLSGALALHMAEESSDDKDS